MKVFNPILSGFHADPSIVNANGECYIANSTFEWFPGVELHRSKDMKTWNPVPSPLSTKTLLDMAGNKASCGIWAPCLTYCESEKLFYLIYTNVRSWNDGPWKDCPNYLTTAPSIEGPWSDPVFMNASGFDASMFHDDDGKHWYINMEWDYRQLGPRQFSGILMQEYDAKQKKLVGSVHKIFRGTDIGLVEGPHLYKRDGYYYIFAAEGGTRYEHAISCGRSKSITGPYEVHPCNPLISSYGHDEIQLQRAGHGAMCKSPDGKKDYLVYLCGRPVEGTERCILGRETGIAELTWKEGWPYVTQPDGSLQNFPPEYIEVEGDGEILPGHGAVHPAEKYTFNNDDWKLDFKTLRIPMTEDRFSTKERPGWLRIHGGQSPVSTFTQGLVARRQTDFAFEAETKLEFNPTNFQHFAGMVYRYDEQTQYLCIVTHDDKLGKVINVLTIMPEGFIREVEIPVEENKPVWIKLKVDGKKGFFWWSQDGVNFRQMRPLLDATKLSDEYGGQGFTGAFVGMYCADMVQYENYADFEYFIYKRK